MSETKFDFNTLNERERVLEKLKEIFSNKSIYNVMLQNKVIEYRDRILTIIADIVNKKSSGVSHSYHRVFDFIYRLIEIKFSLTGGDYCGERNVIDKLLLDLELITLTTYGESFIRCLCNKGDTLINCIFLISDHNMGFEEILNEHDIADDIIMAQLCLDRLRISLEIPLNFPNQEEFNRQALSNLYQYLLLGNSNFKDEINVDINVWVINARYHIKQQNIVLSNKANELTIDGKNRALIIVGVHFEQCRISWQGNVSFYNCTFTKCQFTLNENILSNNNGKPLPQNSSLEAENKSTGQNLLFNNVVVIDKLSISEACTLDLTLKNINHHQLSYQKSEVVLKDTHFSNISLMQCKNISLIMDKRCTIDQISSLEVEYYEFIGDTAVFEELPFFANCKIYSIISVKYNKKFGYAECNAFSENLAKMGCKNLAIEYKAHALDSYAINCTCAEKVPLFMYGILNRKGRSIWLPMLWLLIMFFCWWGYYYLRNPCVSSFNFALKEVLWPLRLLNSNVSYNDNTAFLLGDLFTKIFSTTCIYLFLKGIKMRYETKD